MFGFGTQEIIVLLIIGFSGLLFVGLLLGAIKYLKIDRPDRS